MTFKNRVLWFFLLLPSIVFGQQMVEYNPDFKFQDGIYLSFQDFKNNNPVPVTYILSDLDIRDKDYLELVLDTDSVVYFDNLLEERVISIQSIWGYAKNDRVYIGFNTVDGSAEWQDRGWFPILSIGAYSYFTAVRYVTRYMSPAPGAMMPSYGMSMGMGSGSMYPNTGTYYQEAQNLQMLLEFSSGRLILLGQGDLNSVTPSIMENLLAPDRALLAEFDEQSKRDQKQTSMYYIRRYNERNPIYFPQ